MKKISKLTDYELQLILYDYVNGLLVNQQMSKEETLNFLSYYFEFVARVFDMPTDNFHVNIYGNKFDSGNNIKKRGKILKKDLKKLEKQSRSAYVYRYGYNTPHSYNVVLNNEKLNFSLKDKYCFCNFIEMLEDAGHEFHHIIQNEYYPYTLVDRTIKLWRGNIAKAQAKSFSSNIREQRMLERKIESCKDDICMCHKSEYQADRQSSLCVTYFLDFINNIDADDDFKRCIKRLQRINSNYYKDRLQDSHESRVHFDNTSKFLRDYGLALEL